MATPHVFIFDQQRILRYCGRIDDREKIGTASQHDTRNALEALLAGKEVPVKETRIFGCSVKWKWKNEYRRKLDEEWAQMQVPLEARVKDFLTFKQAAFTANYLFPGEDKYALIEAVDPQWPGNIPYTLTVEPGGKIIGRFHGGVHMTELRKKIVDHPLIGRYF